MLASIFAEFHIDLKVQNVVTNNASNFAKAFSLFMTAEDSNNNACEYDESEVSIENAG